MKGISRILTGLILALAVFSSCERSPETTDNLVSTEFAESLANPENGVLTEVSGNLGMMGGGDMTNVAVSNNGTITITLSNVLGPGFSWDAATNGYRKNGVNVTVSAGNWAGVVSSYDVLVRFYESTDGSGTGVQLTDPKTLASNGNVHSIRYGRVYSGVITNTARNIVRQVNVTTELLITGVNDGTNGVFVTGNRNESVQVTAGVRTGNWTLTASFANVAAYREFIDSGWMTTYQGTADLAFNGSWTGPRGTRTVSTAATVTFNRQRTVTINADGTAVMVDTRNGQTQ